MIGTGIISITLAAYQKLRMREQLTTLEGKRVCQPVQRPEYG